MFSANFHVFRYSRPSSSTIRSALWKTRIVGLAGLGTFSNRWRRFAANFCSLLFSAMASRGPTSETVTWRMQQTCFIMPKTGPKKWSKHAAIKRFDSSSALPQNKQRYHLLIGERGRWNLRMHPQPNNREKIMVEPLRLPVHSAEQCCCKRQPPKLCQLCKSRRQPLFGAVPNPCRTAGLINLAQFHGLVILSPGKTLIMTSAGRRLRVGRALAHAQVEPTCEVGLSAFEAIQDPRKCPWRGQLPVAGTGNVIQPTAQASSMHDTSQR